MGCYNRMTSMRPLDLSVLQILKMDELKDESEERFLRIARNQINGEGAQLIVAGCGALFPSLGPGSRERLEKKLGAPVLEGSGISIKTLEMLVSLKLTHSKMTYPFPGG